MSPRSIKEFFVRMYDLMLDTYQKLRRGLASVCVAFNPHQCAATAVNDIESKVVISRFVGGGVTIIAHATLNRTVLQACASRKGGRP